MGAPRREHQKCLDPVAGKDLAGAGAARALVWWKVVAAWEGVRDKARKVGMCLTIQGTAGHENESGLQ